ncbi:MAG: ribosome biogenesis GTPase Der, partial [Gammaproteobacteria bacterium]|nr:ribosome biogenesis GTPase Der [Gammaproteobacteria bacterium]
MSKSAESPSASPSSTGRARGDLLPVIAIVGRPNVGKSTLFNCLTRSRDALVADEPGLTRDRRYGFGVLGERAHVVVDTGGLSDEGDSLTRAVSSQAMRAVDESDAVILLVDGRAGLTVEDERIADRLRRADREPIVTVNKCEGLDPAAASAEFYALGFARVHAISAAHRQGLGTLVDSILEQLPHPPDSAPPALTGTAIAVIGRPNVGKSTLVNRLLGEERVVAHESAGTTRDSVRVPFERHGRRYTLIDTAGIRRRARTEEKIEKFSVIKSLQAIAAADVVIVVVDAGEGITDQDASLIGTVVDAGRAMTLAVNKWDRLDAPARRAVRADVARKLGFVDYVQVHYVSALAGRGLDRLLASVDAAHQAASAKLATPALNEMLAEAVARNPPPIARGRRIRLRYAHQGGS